jgi:hypothetical protein
MARARTHVVVVLPDGALRIRDEDDRIRVEVRAAEELRRAQHDERMAPPKAIHLLVVVVELHLVHDPYEARRPLAPARAHVLVDGVGEGDGVPHDEVGVCKVWVELDQLVLEVVPPVVAQAEAHAGQHGLLDAERLEVRAERALARRRDEDRVALPP